MSAIRTSARSNAASFSNPMILGRLATEHALATLRARGQQLSPGHQQAIEEACVLLARLASGDQEGRYVIDLPPGAGKTTAVVSFVKTLLSVGPPDWSVVIAAQRIEELEDLFEAITNAVPSAGSEEVAIWFNDLGRRVRPSYPPKDADRYQDHRVLLVTHARLQQADNAFFSLGYEGKPRSLLIHDESFKSAEPHLYPYPELAGALEAIRVRYGVADDVVEAVTKIKERIDREIGAQRNGEAPELLVFDHVDQDLVEKLEEAARSGRSRLGEETLKFFRRLHLPARVLRLGETEAKEFLVQASPLVSAGFERIAILDASYGVRKLVSLAAHRRAKRDPKLGLIPFREASRFTPASFKRYDHVTIRFAQTERSGRTFAMEDLGKNGGGQLAKELVHLVTQVVPPDRGVLVVTMKEDERAKVDPVAALKHSLAAAGVDAAEVIETKAGEKIPKVSFLTYGQETATNSYAGYETVVFLGCLELPPEALAGQYLAETGDMTESISSKKIGVLQLGEIQHRVLQAMSRIAMRGVFLDQRGIAQARASTIYLALRHPEEELEDLKAALPGAKWETWELTHWDERATTKSMEAKEQILEALKTLPAARTKISTTELKRRFPDLQDYSTPTFGKAVDQLPPHGWTREGRSLRRLQ